MGEGRGRVLLECGALCGEERESRLVECVQYGSLRSAESDVYLEPLLGSQHTVKRTALLR